ncbi:MAG: response regulator [Candidatus Zixiibacteriota bacterium]|nr:MAG: response regulator [candidate division Zixibacteria bacterium]
MANILIIEDDQRLRLALKENLMFRGYEVNDAANGLEGIDKFTSNKPDLIVMDIIMPEKEGIETIREIKRDFPSVKIIAISGGGTLGPEHYLKVALAIGADKALKKPFRTDLLVGSIEELLNQ